jgi:hypothetical protein
MWVMGGGRTAPNPSNEVDVYDPGTNAWSIGLPFVTPRRNFATDTNGTNRVWLVGGYDVSGVTLLSSMEIYGQCGTPTPTPTATATSAATATPTVFATPTATATVGTPSPTPTCPPSAFHVLIAYSDEKVQPVMLHDQIAAESGVVAVDYFDAQAGTPTLAQLQPYQIVVAFSDSPYFDPVGMGNVLADYADGGGIVVGFNFDWYGPPFDLEGILLL